RADGKDRFICEAKKPAEELHAAYAFQAKRYAYNKNVYLALLTDFEELKLYIVGGKPHLDRPEVGLWKEYKFQQYPLVAQELWDLLAYENIAAGSIDKAIENLPKRASGTGKARQQWLIRPDRTKSLDNDFLNTLDEARRSLAADLIKNNDRDSLLEGTCLNEATQHILDRLLFLRICEDRDIDTGQRLDSIADTWRKNYGKEAGLREKQHDFLVREEPPAYGAFGRINAPKDSLWHAVVRHFRALDRRPPTHVPFFNGNLFKKHFSEDLLVSDEWLADFIRELSTDESPYLFNIISVEILGTIYERFLGKIVRPHGRGVIIEEKPEVRKAGGVYYTPSYIVDYIVEQTVGKLLNEIVGDARPHPNLLPRGEGTATVRHGKSDVADANPAPGTILPLPEGEGRGEGKRVSIKDLATRTHALTILDPACGSGSFLICAYERVCEHWQRYFTRDLNAELAKANLLSPSLSSILNGGEEALRQPTRSATASDSLTPSDGERARERGLLRSAWEKKHRKHCWVDALTGDVHLTVSLKREILTNNIYGVDLDAAAVEVTQLSLYLKMLENENRNTLARERELFAEEIALLPPLQDNIKNGNSLIASDFSMMAEDLIRVRAFDWPVQFAAIMKSDGFDVVIGNPPYIRIQGFPADQIVYFSNTYRAATGNYDIYVNFIERGLNLLSKTGRLGMILPNKFFRTDYGLGLRTSLSEQHAVAEIVDFGAEQVFDATTYTCLLFLSRKENPAFKFAVSKADEKVLKGLGFGERPGSSLTGDAWTFANETQSRLLEKLKSKSVRLLDLPADMSRGSSSGDDEVFVVEANGHGLEKDILRTPLFASDFGRYHFSPQEKWQIIFPYVAEDNGFRLMKSSELQKKFPKAFTRLLENVGSLKDRKQFKEWFGYSAPRNLQLHDRAQIAVPLLADGGLFALIPKSSRGSVCPMASGGFTITLGAECVFKPEFVLGILNSKLSFWFLRQISNVFRGGWITCTKQYFGELPIICLDFKKPADKARHDKLVGLVDKMLVLVPKLRAAKSP
ncbi:MAG: N-6 DNA methylase, partial [Verrucomicrobiota bacterium]